MKKILILSVTLLLALGTFSCKDLDSLNENPNEPAVVTTPNILSGAQKKMLDYIFDNWFSGRQSLVYSQYWAQRNYTEEDRYQIRESVNNSYFNSLYTVAGNFVLIENMNTDESTKSEAAIYGDNNNQIAVAKILKVWLMQVMADTWGSIPYSEAFKLSDNTFYPKYDDLTQLYPALIDELDAAIALIDVNKDAFTQGDLIYDGDAGQWLKFANSLKCRFAIRLSKVDSSWKTIIAQAIASGVFESNDDEAVFTYSQASPNECYFYRGFFVDKRNDFSITKTLTQLLKGENDVLNGKTNPFEGIADPRLAMFAGTDQDFDGVPYGVSSDEMGLISEVYPNFYNIQPAILQPNYSIQLMSYAELCFILSEYNNFDESWYRTGIESSIEWWSQLSGEVVANVSDYIDAVSVNVNAETVATQKYIHLYGNGTEAWAEYRRTGYPTCLLKPGEISTIIDGENVLFTALSETKDDLPARIKYPTNESTLNTQPFVDAVAKLQDGTNNYYSKMFWDVRTTAVPHPANK